TTTKAEGSTDAQKVGLGVAFALTSASDKVAARVASVNAGGGITIGARSATGTSAEATASAKGGETSGTGADGKVSAEEAKAASASGKNVSGAPSAKSPDGTFTFAGAVAVNLTTSEATAAVEDNGAVQAGGALT